MKLFLVGDYPKDSQTHGGVQGVLVNLVYELSKNDEVETVLVSTSGSIDQGMAETGLKTYSLNFRSSFFEARKRFNAIVETERPNVIHLQGVVPGVLLYRNKFRNIFVVTQHAILGKERLLQVSLSRKLLFRFKELIENYYLHKIRNIIFISDYNRNVYFERFQDKKHLRYKQITNPVNEIFFKQKTLNVVPKNKELYFVGEVKKRKGLHVLLQAVHRLKQQGSSWKVHVIGGFKESSYETDIRQMIADLDLTENIVFCGWKNQREIISYTADIPIFVLPSFQETLPLSIAEAMCLGKITVATDICGIPEMIEHGTSGYLFPPGDFAKLADILKNISEDTNKRKRISKAAKVASQKHHPKNVVQSTVEFYRSIQ